MRQRDLLVLLACGVGIFISFQRDPGDGFRLRRSWSFPLDQALYKDGTDPQPHEKLPPPLVTDIDGDGQMDVVLVTKEPSVKLLGKAGLRFSTGKKGDFRPASPTHEATLLSSIVRLSTGRQPAALASGYIDPPPKDPITLRRQVVVVVTQDWTVLCFDEKLKLMWESNLQVRPSTRLRRRHALNSCAGAQDFVPDDFYHREIAVAITPVGVFKGDRGMVIVAGSTRHELTVGGDEYWEEHEAQAAAEAAAEAGLDPTKVSPPTVDYDDDADDDEEENPQDDLLIEQARLITLLCTARCVLTRCCVVTGCPSLFLLRGGGQPRGAALVARSGRLRDSGDGRRQQPVSPAQLQAGRAGLSKPPTPTRVACRGLLPSLTERSRVAPSPTNSTKTRWIGVSIATLSSTRCRTRGVAVMTREHTPTNPR